MLTAVAICAFVAFGAVAMVTRAMLTRDPLWSIGEAPAGEPVHIVGVVRAIDGATLEAPISQLPCQFYTLNITELTHTLANERRGLVFELDDGTGVSRIDPRGATVELASKTFHNTPLTAPTAHQVEFLERRGYRGGYLDVHYRETLVQVGDRIAVFGRARRENNQLTFATSVECKLLLADGRGATRVRIPRAHLREH